MEALFSRTLEKDRDDFAALLDAIESFLREQYIPDKTAQRIMISCDEVISNILNHAKTSEIAVISVNVRTTPENVSVEIIDNGPEFNPLSVPPPDTGLSLEDRKAGGLGIYLVRELMDDVRYIRENSQNRLLFNKILSL
ncbi:ATP-binding protein [Parasphingorhabdus sp. JC815]|uniref:ATP-binding protein n=1 Tax=Parasphingorhabdus sp. JC815 TaxID=3232140 RepID=UPI0034598014